MVKLNTASYNGPDLIRMLKAAMTDRPRDPNLKMGGLGRKYDKNRRKGRQKT